MQGDLLPTACRLLGSDVSFDFLRSDTERHDCQKLKLNQWALPALVFSAETTCRHESTHLHITDAVIDTGWLETIMAWHDQCLLRHVLDIFSGLQTLQQSLDYHLERHNLLASNVAHVDTPGYKPHDLSRVDAGSFAAVFNIEMQRTAEGHLSGIGDNAQSSVGRVFEDSSAGFGADGNSVSLDREATKLAANHLRYDVVSTIVASELKGLTYAANDGRG